MRLKDYIKQQGNIHASCLELGNALGRSKHTVISWYVGRRFPGRALWPKIETVTQGMVSTADLLSDSLEDLR